MNKFRSKLQTNRTPKSLYLLLRLCSLACAVLLVALPVHGQQKDHRFDDAPWPQFRGPESNPVGTHARLAERWSKTENVEWSQEIPGRG